jgi:imidazole glycerol-phosphate synthase subunit HisH
VIGIVDYGLGNISSFENIYRRLGIAVTRVRNAKELDAVNHLILPGVGAFDWAMERLVDSGMLEALNRRVLEDKIPVLGVCVGMQIMARCSDEGSMAGLGWIPGVVRRFDDHWFNQRTHLPHMGWNDITAAPTECLFRDLGNPQFYFLHSYYFSPDEGKFVIARTHYGIAFASAIRRENIWATQFHPEKSHGFGVKLLKNFSEI